MALSVVNPDAGALRYELALLIPGAFLLSVWSTGCDGRRI